MSRPTRRYHAEKAVAALLLLAGTIFSFGGYRYGLGSMRHWGAGAFPFVCGLALIVLSVVCLCSAAKGREAGTGSVWRGMGAIAAGMAGFAAIIGSWGLLPATFLLASLSGIGTGKLKVRHILALAASLCLLMYLLFVILLRLPLPIFRGTYG
ncbi:tripartite tricarboxylate transporter TctB family protein [Billgrantia endophytica]|nr:tripartite tricarboxylate transporter TctB family protein [Halomonas endophytica]